MPSPLTIASQKRVAVIGCNSETSLQGWFMSAHHHSNGSKLGSCRYLGLFVCRWSGVCSCSRHANLPSTAAQSSISLSTEISPQGEAWSLDMLLGKTKEQLIFCFAVLILLHLCTEEMEVPKEPKGFHVPVLFSLSLSYACNQTLIFEIKNLQDSLLGLLNLQSSLFRMATYLLLNEAIMQLLL